MQADVQISHAHQNPALESVLISIQGKHWTRVERSLEFSASKCIVHLRSWTWVQQAFPHIATTNSSSNSFSNMGFRVLLGFLVLFFVWLVLVF